jgi:hypothetical protein
MTIAKQPGQPLLLAARWHPLSLARPTQVLALPGYGGYWPPHRDIDGARFERKAEYHVTVIGSVLGSYLLQAIEAGSLVEARVAELYEREEWRCLPLPRFLLLSRARRDGAGDEASVIQLLELPGMARFYAALRRLLPAGQRIPTPPPHITLYTRNGARGIGLRSHAVLRELSVRPVSLGELRA